MALTTLPTAGAKLRGSVLSSLVTEVRPVAARKTVNETVNNSAALQNDDALFVAVVANAVYDVKLVLHYTSGTTPDLKIGWTAPSGATMVWGGYLFSTASAFTATGNNAVGTVVALGGLGADVSAVFDGTVVTSTTAGTLQLQWAQNTANASDSTVYAGSFLELRRTS